MFIISSGQMWKFKVCMVNRVFKCFKKYVRNILGWVPSEVNFGTRIQVEVTFGEVISETMGRELEEWDSEVKAARTVKQVSFAKLWDSVKPCLWVSLALGIVNWSICSSILSSSWVKGYFECLFMLHAATVAARDTGVPSKQPLV